MIASACLMLAAINLMVWFRHRVSLDRLALGSLAVSTAVMAFLELSMMRAESPESYSTLLRWFHVPVLACYFAVIVFIRCHLRAGRLWLAWTGAGLRTLSLVINFLSGENINYTVITGLRQVPFLGDLVAIPVGVPHPMLVTAQGALLLLIIFLVDAAVEVWRRGEKRRALTVAGGFIFWVMLATVLAVLSFWQIVPLPLTSSLFFTGMILSMAIELSLDSLRAGALVEELRTAREGRRREVAHLGRVAVMGELSASLAHEMNQPLGIILSNAQAGQRLLAKDRPDLAEVRHILRDIVSAGLRAAEVIKRWRTLLKRDGFRCQPVLPDELADEVLQLMTAIFRERQVTLIRDVAPGLPPVSGDRVQLQQVLLNLIVNACEAMEGNPPERRQLTVAAGGGAQGVWLSVADRGPGLPAGAEVIFQPFHTTKEQGLGMGLAICQSIVTAHRGELHAESHPGGGAVFKLFLPAAEIDQ